MDKKEIRDGDIDLFPKKQVEPKMYETKQDMAGEIAELTFKLLKLKSYVIEHDHSCMQNKVSHYEDRAGTVISADRRIYDPDYHKIICHEICTCGLDDLLKD